MPRHSTSRKVRNSSRLRLLVAEHCGVAVQNVHAYIAGEHGDSEIPLWSSASIGSVPLLAWEVPGRPPLDAAARTDIRRRVVGAAGEIIRGKGATNYAVGLAAARIIEAVLYDQRQVLPVSSLLEGQAGIADVCLSLPSVETGTTSPSAAMRPISWMLSPKNGFLPTIILKPL